MENRLRGLTLVMMLLLVSLPRQVWAGWGWGPKDPKGCVTGGMGQLTKSKIEVSVPKKVQDQLKSLERGSSEQKGIVQKYQAWLRDAQNGNHTQSSYADHDVGGGRRAGRLSSKYRVVYKRNGDRIEVIEINDHNKGRY